MKPAPDERQTPDPSSMIPALLFTQSHLMQIHPSCILFDPHSPSIRTQSSFYATKPDVTAESSLKCRSLSRLPRQLGGQAGSVGGGACKQAARLCCCAYRGEALCLVQAAPLVAACWDASLLDSDPVKNGIEAD